MAQIMETIARWALPLTVGYSAVSMSLYNVDAGHAAVIFDRLSGVLPKSVEEGTHFLIPWLQRPIFFDVRTKPRNISTTTGSKDMQTVSLTLRVLHRPEAARLHEIYSKLGLDYEERVYEELVLIWIV
jgi:prohibitin 1